MHVTIRTDGNQETGFGHLSRCKALAEKLGDHGAAITFLLAKTPGDIATQLEERGFDHRFLLPDARKDDPEHLANAAKEASRDAGTPFLITDLRDEAYHKPPFQRAVIEQGVQLMTITHNLGGSFASTLVHNQNPMAQEATFDLPRRSQALIGLRYAILRDEFTRHAGQAKPNKPPRTVLVTLGGADRSDQIRTVVRGLAQLEDPLEAILLVGPLYEDVEGLRRLVESTGLEADVHVDTPEMARLMTHADLAISSGGITLWELACVGVPTLAISRTPFERETASYLEREGALKHIGHHDEIDPQDVADATRSLQHDAEARRQARKKGLRLVDGQGAQRVAKAIKEHGGKAR